MLNSIAAWYPSLIALATALGYATGRMLGFAVEPSFLGTLIPLVAVIGFFFYLGIKMLEDIGSTDQQLKEYWIVLGATALVMFQMVCMSNPRISIMGQLVFLPLAAVILVAWKGERATPAFVIRTMIMPVAVGTASYLEATGSRIGAAVALLLLLWAQFLWTTWEWLLWKRVGDAWKGQFGPDIGGFS